MASNVGLGICLIVCTIAMLVMAIAFQWQSGSSLHEMELQIIEHERRVGCLQIVYILLALSFCLFVNAPMNTSDKKMPIKDHEILCNFREMRKDIRLRQEPWEESERFTDSLNRALIHDGAEQMTMNDLIEGDDETEVVTINLRTPLYPCYVISVKSLRTLRRIITHEEAMKLGLLEELTKTTRRPSCALTYFISHNWIEYNFPDSKDNIKLKWLQNLPKHFDLKDGEDAWYVY